MRMMPLILLFLLVYIETKCFIAVADIYGVLLSLLLLISTSIIGFSLVRNQGLKTLMQFQQKVAQQENPTHEATKSISIMMAGFLLIIPGFFTDFLGLLLLLPPVQKLLARHFFKRFRAYVAPNSTTFRSEHFYYHSGNQTNSDEHRDNQGGNIIDGEFERKDDENKSNDDQPKLK